MRLEKNEHRRIMLRILMDISADPKLAINLGFKGGTCCYFVYGLDRFSVDLDFDLLNREHEEVVLQKLIKLLGKYGEVSTKQSIKLKYSDEYQALKIDVSTRYDINKLNMYNLRDIVSGVPMQVLRQDQIFAHKLVALTDRGFGGVHHSVVVANRDLYDIWFFLMQGWIFDEEIITLRTGKSGIQYLNFAMEFIRDHVDESNILEGLGALVDDAKRKWVKAHLKSEVLKLLAIEKVTIEN